MGGVHGPGPARKQGWSLAVGGEKAPLPAHLPMLLDGMRANHHMRETIKLIDFLVSTVSLFSFLFVAAKPMKM